MAFHNKFSRGYWVERIHNVIARYLDEVVENPCQAWSEIVLQIVAIEMLKCAHHEIAVGSERARKRRRAPRIPQIRNQEAMDDGANSIVIKVQHFRGTLTGRCARIVAERVCGRILFVRCGLTIRIAQVLLYRIDNGPELDQYI